MGIVFLFLPTLLGIPFIGILSLIGVVMSLVFGSQVKKRATEKTNRDTLLKAKIGSILGYIGLGIYVLSLLIVIVAVILLLTP